jgi:hypothetical protein
VLLVVPLHHCVANLISPALLIVSLRLLSAGAGHLAVCLQAVSRIVSMYHCISSLFAPRCTAVWLDVAGRPAKMAGLSLLNVSQISLLSFTLLLLTLPIGRQR